MSSHRFVQQLIYYQMTKINPSSKTYCIAGKFNLYKKHRYFATNLLILAISFLVMLGLLSSVYAIWLDSLNIVNTVETGVMDYSIIAGACTPDSIHYQNSEDDCLSLQILQPQAHINYIAEFEIRNQGSLPIKVQNAELFGFPDNITGTIKDLGKNSEITGSVIDPSNSVHGQIEILFNEVWTENITFSIKLTILQWNLD